MLDHELIDQFVSDRSQDAFAEIVRRHMNMVYASARRQVHDLQLAEDVTQAVFIILAKKASQLRHRASLAGWLMKTTHLAGRDALKIESRRKRHEAAAAALAQSGMEQRMTQQNDSLWPQLDSALARLSEADRAAITLRYLEDNSTAELALALGISEPAAAKRITRALDRLRTFLVHKEAMKPAASLAFILDQIPRDAAPAALTHSVIAAATSAAASPAGVAIANGVIHIMTWKKIIAAMWLIVASAGAAGISIGTVKLLADQTSPPPPQKQDSPSPQRAADLVGKLSNGVSVEVIGINEYPATGKAWWTAEGNAAAPELHINIHGNIDPISGYLRREVAVRINHAVAGNPDPATVHWYLPVGGGSSYSNVESEGPDHRSIEAAAVGVLDTPQGRVIRADVAAGPWKTACTCPGAGEVVMGGADAAYLFSRAFVIGGETHIIVGTMRTGPPQAQYPILRLVAVDRSGRQTVAQGGFGMWQSGSSMLEFTVRLTAGSISAWKLQTRTYDQWIEFRNISLHRDQTSFVEVVTSDDQHR
jgi:RNA polymerase sigma factor (sigma-70 family)